MPVIRFSLFSLFLLHTWAAQAATRPTDRVSVLNMTISAQNGEGSEQIYTRPWSTLKLAPKTRAKINALNAALDKEGFENFKVIWIRLVNQEVQRVMFQGHRSTIWVYDFIPPPSGDQKCYVTVDGNGMMGGCQP
jgi:hypothetical protein